MTRLYLNATRISFMPARIVRARNDNVAAAFSSAADGAGAVLLDCGAAPAAVFLSSHSSEITRG